jgi:hypothetical protein
MQMQRTRSPAPAKPVSGTWRWAVQPTSTHPGCLVINTTSYMVEELLDALCLVGYRLKKHDGTTYDIDIGQSPWACECGDYQYRRANRDAKGCKHVAALRAALAAIGALPQEPQRVPA